MKHWIRSLVAAAALTACASESYQRVPMPSQEVELSSPSMCRIYVVRMPQVRGAVRTVLIDEDERHLARIGNDEFACWERQPGRTLVVVTYEGTMFSDKQSFIDVQAEAGHVYYYGISIDETWSKPVVTPMEHDEAVAVLKDQRPAPTK